MIFHTYPPPFNILIYNKIHHTNKPLKIAFCDITNLVIPNKDSKFKLFIKPLNQLKPHQLFQCLGFAIFVTLITLIYMLLLKKILTLNIKAQIKRMKKTGTLPCDFESVYEFNEESITETSSTARTEQSYRAIEKICVVKDRYILLYNSSISVT